MDGSPGVAKTRSLRAGGLSMNSRSPGRNLLLPLAHGDARNDGHDRRLHHASEERYRPRVDRDFTIILQEYAILPNIKVPNSLNMEFNWLTLNGKARLRRLL